MTTAFPLRWPDGWPRTPAHSRGGGTQFGTKRYDGGYGRNRITLDRARRLLSDELDRLGAKSVVMSSNVPLRSDGMPHGAAGDRRYDEPGVALYFVLNKKPTVMAQDAFDNPAANFRSLGLAVQALRSLERHGGGTMMQRAFDGFAALPPPAGSKPVRPWWEVMRYSADAEERAILSLAEVKARYRNLAKSAHPDITGSGEPMQELNAAMEQATQEFEAR